MVGVVLLNWNGMAIKGYGKPILEECINTLRKVDYKNMKILLVDADSEDDSIEWVKRSGDIDIIKLEDKGWSYANNTGMRYLYHKYPEIKYFLLLSNDVAFRERGWLRKFIAAAEADDKTGIVGSKLLVPLSNEIQYSGSHVSFWGHHKQYSNPNKSKYVESVMGTLMLVKVELLKEIGLIDETFNWNYEDADLCERTLRSGHKIYYLGNVNVWHVGSAGLGKKVYTMKFKVVLKRQDFLYYITRNNYIFILRYRPFLLAPTFVYNIANAFFNVSGGLRFKERDEMRTLAISSFTGLAGALSEYKKRRIDKLDHKLTTKYRKRILWSRTKNEAS